uniref:Mevalonate kinase-like protein n=1 Tax=Antonospora locustae TaxID=278021 RepID=Q6E6I3_ANTLO|nr:mevalonate kinase-like protein [Antonospora locustae]
MRYLKNTNSCLVSSTTKKRTMRFRVPGKVVLNGGYLVCMEEECIAVNIDAYANVEAETDTESPQSTIVHLYGDTVVLRITESGLIIDSAADADTGKFIRDIVVSFWDVVRYDVQLGVNVYIAFDNGFCTCNGVKTGIGSSACIVVALVHSFCALYSVGRSTPSLCLEVNRKVAPRASGVDVLTCSYGNVIYSTRKHARIDIDTALVLVLGSRGMSSSTRDMITLLDGKGKIWTRLSEINARIVAAVRQSGAIRRRDCVLRPLYHEYLREIAQVSSLIVPEYQYAVLLETFFVKKSLNAVYPALEAKTAYGV